MLINGEKWACDACVRGHRVSSCTHSDRPLQQIDKKGRPVSQCPRCKASSIAGVCACPTTQTASSSRRLTDGYDSAIALSERGSGDFEEHVWLKRPLTPEDDVPGFSDSKSEFASLPQHVEGPFYCSDLKCANSPPRFARKREWKNHMDTHTRPYICRMPGCEKIPGFTYSGGLLRHEREVHQVHGGAIKRHYCPHVDCKRSEGLGFARKEHLTEHLRRVHMNQAPIITSEVSTKTMPLDQQAYLKVDAYRRDPHGEMRSLAHTRTIFYDSLTGLYPSLSGIEENNHLLAFSIEIIRFLQLNYDNESLPANLISSLPDLLKIFALKLGYHGCYPKEKAGRDAMLIISQHPNIIVTILQSQWKTYRMVVKPLDASHWRTDQIKEPIDRPKIPQDDSFLDQARAVYNSAMLHKTGVETIVDKILPNMRLAITNPACIWLTRKMITSLHLSSLGTTDDGSFRRIIYSCFPKLRELGKEILTCMTFNVHWPLEQFLQAHHFHGADNIESILRHFVTLTSDGSHTQGLAALQYCRMVWGQNGEQILDLIADILRNGKTQLLTTEFTLTACMDSNTVRFIVTGFPDSVVEIVEQIAWMGAVFRTPPVAEVIHDCIAFIGNIQRKTAARLESYGCDITYYIATSESESDAGSADCWRSLFKYINIAQGFPICQREEAIHGLEMSLGTMLTLCHARHIGMVNDRIIIKGFSAMFSLSERRPGVSIWHFSGNLDGPYLSSSSAASGQHCSNLGIPEILHDRHFIGWCSGATYGVGALDEDCYIRPSQVRPTYPGCVLHGKIIRRGYTYPLENAYIADSKENPRRTSTQSLQERLKRIHMRPVVLWDDAEKRGWLTNGTSALLHLALASVVNSGNPFDSYCLHKDEIRQREKDTVNAAAYILLDQRNWKLPIQWDDGKPVYFRDRIEDLYFLLDLAIEHQITSLSSSRMLSDVLEGWDFIDIAGMAIDPLNPRAFPLTKDCCGWMTFLEDTKAITLFGRDFGDIFRPTNTSLCNYWSTLPKHKCYLAANLCDLEAFAKAYHGSSEYSPRKLTANTIWPYLSQSSVCDCSEFSPQHIDLLQILVPEALFTAQPKITSTRISVSQKGVVIFGEVKDRSWFKSSDCGSPRKNPLKRARHETESSPKDSGIGDSISSIPAFETMECPMFSEYFVAIICAFPEELLAVRQLFDQSFQKVEFDKHDENSYAFGRMSSHNVVAACLPGIYGTCSAAHLITELKRSFPSVEFCLLVGIGGGIPSEINDIRLGDVVVSCPKENHSGTIKHDFLRVTQGGEVALLGHQREPPERLLSAINLGRSNPDNVKDLELLCEYVNKITREHTHYGHPGVDLDILYDSNHHHNAMVDSCTPCCKHVIQRIKRETVQPHVHYGLIASGDQVIKDSKTRDRIGQKYNALCFEMEGAGVVNVIPSLIIRGICDYADSHKNDIWRNYAAATAAAFAKFILGKVRPSRTAQRCC